MGRGGFEPPKSATADLQSAPFGHSGTYPCTFQCGKWSRRWDLNPQPADYKSAALPIELRRLIWTAQKPLFQSQLTICVAVFYYGFDMAAQLSYHMDRRNARTFLKFTDKNILYHRAWRHIFSPHRYKPAHFPSAYHKDNRSQWRL